MLYDRTVEYFKGTFDAISREGEIWDTIQDISSMICWSKYSDHFLELLADILEKEITEEEIKKFSGKPAEYVESHLPKVAIDIDNGVYKKSKTYEIYWNSKGEKVYELVEDIDNFSPEYDEYMKKNFGENYTRESVVGYRWKNSSNTSLIICQNE